MILLTINNNPIGVIISVFAAMMLQPHSPQLAIMSSFQLVLNQIDYDKLSIAGIGLLLIVYLLQYQRLNIE